MKVVVVDASIAIKWVLREPDSSVAKSLLTEWIGNKTVILAPALLAYEITNSLYRKARKGEISLEEARLGLRSILLTGLELDFSHDPLLGIKAMELATRFDLPATYDSYYLALAEREGCELWTADMKMGRPEREKLDWVRWLADYHTTRIDTTGNDA